MKNSKDFSLILIPVMVLMFSIIPGPGSAASISGSILDEDNELVTENVAVWISTWQDYRTEEWDRIVVNGTYSFTDLDADIYILYANTQYVDSWYYPVYYPDSYSIEGTDWINLEQGGDATEVDFTFHLGGKFTGSVTPEEGGDFPELGIRVELSDSPFEIIGGFVPLNPGDYSSGVIPTGEYLIRFLPLGEDMHVPVYAGGEIFYTEAEFVTITEEVILPDIDGTLPLGGGISGTVTGDGDPVEQVFVVVVAQSPGGMPWERYPFGFTFTDEDGDYTLCGIPEGTVIVAFDPPPDEGYTLQWYDGVYDGMMATPIEIVADEITENIDAELTRGVEMSGTIFGPDGEIPEFWEVEINAVTGNGTDFALELEIDEEGNWTSYEPVPPGYYTLYRVAWADWNGAEGFYGASLLYWEAEWQHFEAGGEGNFDIVFEEGATIEGTITDPDGDPVDDANVHLYIDGIEVIARDTDEDGNYYFGGVPTGSYIVKAVLDTDDEEDNGIEPNDIDPDRPYPAIFSGGAFGLEDAEPVEVEAGDELTLDFQFVEGGILHVFISDPDGDPYDLFEQNVGVMAFAIGEDGTKVANEPSSADGPFGDPEGVDIVLPVGSYHVGGLPLYIPINPAGDPPNVRRTWYEGDGEVGGFTNDNAEVVTITAGEITEIELRMVEEGYSVSGSFSNEVDLVTMSPVMIVMDEDSLWVAAAANIIFTFEPEYLLKGVPDGEYKLLAMIGDEDPSYLVSTWYPDISDPGANFDFLGNPPDNAGTFEVAGADVENIDIDVRTVEYAQFVPEKQRIALLKGYRLSNAYPNPFNSQTRFSFTLPVRDHVKIAVFNVLGRQVAEIAHGRYEAGTHLINFNAKNLASGVYFIKMKTSEFEAIRKLILLR